MRKYLLYAAALLVMLYSLGVLWHVHNKRVLEIHCLLRGTNADGPLLAVDEGVESVGGRPRSGDRIVSVGGEAVPTFVHFNRRISALNETAPSSVAAVASPQQLTVWSSEQPGRSIAEVGDQRWVRIEFLKQDADVGAAADSAWLPLRPISTDALLVTVAWFVLELLIFGIGVVVVWKRPGDPSADMFCTLCAVHVVTFMGAFHWPSLVDSRLLTYPFVLCTLLLAPLMLHFYLLFPRPVYLIRQWPITTLASIYAIPALFIVLMFQALVAMGWLYGTNALPGEVSRQLDQFTRLMYFYIPISLGMFLAGQGVLVHSFLHARTVAERNQVRWLLGAMFLAAWPVAHLLYTSTYEPAEFVFGLVSKWMMYLTSVIFAIGYAVSITRYKLMQVAWVNRGLLYVAISFTVTMLFCLLVGVGTALVGRFYFSWENALAAGATAMLVVVIIGALRDRFQHALDRRFHRERYQLDKAMRRLSEAVDQLVEPDQLARQLLQSICDTVRSQRGAVYLRHTIAGPFELAARVGWPVLPQTLEASTQITASATDGRPSMPLTSWRDATNERPWRLMGASLCLELERDGTTVGMVLLGAKQDSTPYSREDRNFLTALAQTTALALQSAQGHRTIEQLRHELQKKVQKIAEQQQRIVHLQTELLHRHETAAGGEAASSSPSMDLPPDMPTIHGASPAIKSLLAEAMKVARSNSSVLIRGESGTGKELLAEAIHRQSPRSRAPFIQVHCAALSPSLLESELFGHVKGAFTGAERDKIGRFEMADGGTLFLDEIGDIDWQTQTKLLRVLQQRSFERVGGTKTIQVDVRLIAATHQNLEELIRGGRFREDLFYRLNVISLHCPSLRERREDIFPLALYFLRRFAAAAGKPMLRLDEEAIRALESYHWPGNVRQLENCIERAVVLTEAETIQRQHLPPEVRGAPRDGSVEITRRLRQSRGPRPTAKVLTAASLDEEIGNLERDRLRQALETTGGNKAEAARLLGLPRSTFFSKLRKLGIE